MRLYIIGANIPNYLKSTINMIKSAYPSGISDADYPLVIKVLYEEMSDRNIIDVIHIITNIPKHVIQNDIYKIISKEIDCKDVIDKFRDHGYNSWINE